MSAVRSTVVVAEVDLVLSRRHLVVRRLDLEPHVLESEDDLPPDLLALIDRCEIEVAAGIVRSGQRLTVSGLEEEELRLGSGHHLEAHALRLSR